MILDVSTWQRDNLRTAIARLLDFEVRNCSIFRSLNCQLWDACLTDLACAIGWLPIASCKTYQRQVCSLVHSTALILLRWCTLANRIYIELLKARDSAVREQYIRLMRSKLIRAELEKCQRHEGVQHHTVCKYWKDLYLEAVERGDNELRGYKSIERTESNSMNQNHWVMYNSIHEHSSIHVKKGTETSRNKWRLISQKYQKMNSKDQFRHVQVKLSQDMSRNIQTESNLNQIWTLWSLWTGQLIGDLAQKLGICKSSKF